jgi:hypothetical protein
MLSRLGLSLRGFFFRDFFIVVQKASRGRTLPQVYQFSATLQEARQWTKPDLVAEELIDLSERAPEWSSHLTPTTLAPCLGQGGFAVVYYVAKCSALRVTFAPPSSEGPRKTLASELYRTKYDCPLNIQEFQADEQRVVDACCFHVSLPRYLEDDDLTLSEPVGRDLYYIIYEHVSSQMPWKSLLKLCGETLNCYKCLRAKNLMHGDLTLNNFIYFEGANKVLMIDLGSLVSVDPETFECTNVDQNRVALQDMNGTVGFCSTRPPGTSPFEEDAYAVLWVVQHLVSRVRLSSIEQKSDGRFSVTNTLTEPIFIQLALWVAICHQKLQAYVKDPSTSAQSRMLEQFVDTSLDTFGRLLSGVPTSA